MLSYVSGPALLTNATALLLLSTTNRFGRSIDRSRVLAARLADAGARAALPSLEAQMVNVQQRVRLMARALFGLYLAAAMFALSTLAAIIAAALAEVCLAGAVNVVMAAALLSGAVGFLALATASVAMVADSRLAMQTLTLEAADALPAAGKPRQSRDLRMAHAGRERYPRETGRPRSSPPQNKGRGFSPERCRLRATRPRGAAVRRRGGRLQCGRGTRPTTDDGRC